MPSKYELKRGYRNPKFLVNRKCGYDNGVTLIAHPLWPGETLKRVTINGQAYGSVLENAGMELNWRGIIVPALDIGFGPIGSETTDQNADTTATLDAIYKGFVKGPEQDATDQAYGGSYHIETSTEHTVGGIVDYPYSRNTAETFFKRENMLSPLDSTNVFETFRSNGTKDYYIQRPSILMLGAHRWEADQSTEFGLKNWGEIFEDATDRTYWNLMWDPSFIEEQLKQSVDISESMATAQMKLVQLMLGDNYHGTDDNEGFKASDDCYIRVKASLGIQTPIKASIIGSDPN